MILPAAIRHTSSDMFHKICSMIYCFRPHLAPLPPRPLLSLAPLSPRSRSLEDILAVGTLLGLPESRSFLCDHSHYFCHWFFGLLDNLVIHFIYSAVTAKVLLARLHFRYYLRDPNLAKIPLGTALWKEYWSYLLGKLKP